ncbi:MAG: CDP-glucose 4,6-dehydratase [Azonexus sp.]|uniref:CDP-glucose 4,6-dehydratase n=1 Tax=Azonexus sp. TaxID=1872668 RepID=UPI002837A27F|nr:CDP-glucose 4,6-dehydratase [Azonexus sp.]MDR0777703.1 CDP-glucose 4,6-dehydratase [Azonexus sp.]
MEDLVSATFWRGRRVFLTGHSGFKGSWLALWLHQLGAEVTGYALPPPTDPSLFEIARVSELLTSIEGDIRDGQRLAAAVVAARPQTLFHLAAQPLVSEGYADPVGTYATNVMGTINLLEAAHRCPGLDSIVVITSDKCYRNRETGQDYEETDPLGGHDPYSSSKACTELVAASYRDAFLRPENGPRLATARTGNVIGGGDWAAHRLVPDLLGALTAGRAVELRHPDAVRPWQHVLEPLAGYLRLAERLAQSAEYARAWNFGPALADCVTAANLAERFIANWPTGGHWHSIASPLPHEAKLLHLNTDAARQMLEWLPRWPLTEAIRHTVAWHRHWLAGHDMQAFSRQQIEHYLRTPLPTA